MKRWLLILALAVPCWATSLTYVQTGTSYPAGSSASVSLTITAGHFVGIYTRTNATPSTFTITTTNSDTVSTDSSCHLAGTKQTIQVSWISSAVGGATTVNMSSTGSGSFSGMVVVEYSGQAVSPFDGSACTSSNGIGLSLTTPTYAGAITTTQHDDLYFSGFSSNNGCVGSSNYASPSQFNYIPYANRSQNLSGGNMYDGVWDSNGVLSLQGTQNFALTGSCDTPVFLFAAFKSASPQTFTYYISGISLGSPWSYNATNYPTHYILGDTWNPVIGDDGLIYTTTDDTPNGWDTTLGSGSNFMVSTLSTDDTSTIGTLVNAMSQFGTYTQTGSDSRTFKTSGLAFIGSTMYLDTDRQSASSSGATAGCPNGTGYNGTNGQIIKSTDHGVNWTPLPPSTANPYVSPEFAGTGFAKPWFVKYPNGCPGIDSCNTYMYGVSPGAGLQSEDNTLVIGRVALTDDPTDGTKWSWYQSGGTWGALGTAASILTFNCHTSESDIVYIPHYQVYVKIEWTHTDNGSWVSSKTYWYYFEAAHPWGPWYQFGAVQSWNPQGYYMPAFFTNSISGSNATVVAAGDFGSQSPISSAYYTLWEIVATFSGTAAPASASGQIGIFAVGP